MLSVFAGEAGNMQEFSFQSQVKVLQSDLSTISTGKNSTDDTEEFSLRSPAPAVFILSDM